MSLSFELILVDEYEHERMRMCLEKKVISTSATAVVLFCFETSRILNIQFNSILLLRIDMTFIENFKRKK